MQVSKRDLALCGFVLACSLILAACGGLWGTPSPDLFTTATALINNPTVTPFQPEVETQAGISTPNPIPPQPVVTSAPSLLWVSPAVPDILRQLALASGLSLVEAQDAATTRLDISPPEPSNNPASVWIYVLVTPFPTTTDEVTLQEIQNTWTGVPSGPFAGRQLWMDESTLAAFTALWGTPATEFCAGGRGGATGQFCLGKPPKLGNHPVRRFGAALESIERGWTIAGS